MTPPPPSRAGTSMSTLTAATHEAHATNDVPAVGQLGFDRTVDRSLVHRSALSEVFLTDCRPTGRDAYVAAAQLPSSHAYYGDHLLRDPVADTLLLLECCRQAETYGGHTVFGVPLGTKFVLLHWSLEVAPPGLPVAPGRPTELEMAVDGVQVRRTGSEVRGLTYRTSMSAGGAPVGSASIRVGYLSRDAYDTVRMRGRTGRLPSSLAIAPTPVAALVPPHLVGRADANNVLLFDAVADTAAMTARIRPAVDHPSMFDHAQDHLPGMVLMEAGRQASVLALNDLRAVAPSRCVLTALDVRFTEFAELDAPTMVRARPVEVPAAAVDGWPVEIEFLQAGTVIAAGTMTLSPTAPANGAMPRPVLTGLAG